MRYMHYEDEGKSRIPVEKQIEIEIIDIARRVGIPVATLPILEQKPIHMVVHGSVLTIPKYRERLHPKVAEIVEGQLHTIRQTYPYINLGLEPIPEAYLKGGIYVFCGGFFGAFPGASVTHAIMASQKGGYRNIYLSPIGVLPDSALIK